MNFIFRLGGSILVGVGIFMLTAYILGFVLLPSMNFVASRFEIYEDDMFRSLVAFGTLFSSMAIGITAIVFTWFLSSNN